MAWLYLLRGGSGRFYLGSTNDLPRRLAEHCSGKTWSTRRLGGSIELVGSIQLDSLQDAKALERRLKAWKNHAKVLAYFETHSR